MTVTTPRSLDLIDNALRDGVITLGGTAVTVAFATFCGGVLIVANTACC